MHEGSSPPVFLVQHLDKIILGDEEDYLSLDAIDLAGIEVTVGPLRWAGCRMRSGSSS
jgi:hypothetical protein